MTYGEILFIESRDAGNREEIVGRIEFNASMVLIA